MARKLDVEIQVIYAGNDAVNQENRIRLSSSRRGAFLGVAPPQRRADPDHDHDRQQQKQRRLLEPGDRGHPQCQDRADEAEAPGPDVNSPAVNVPSASSVST